MESGDTFQAYVSSYYLLGARRNGLAAQIQGHKPQAVREQNYIRRPLDLLRMWHVKIEAWMLEQAEVEFNPEQLGPVIRAIK